MSQTHTTKTRKALDDGVPLVVEHDGTAWAVVAIYPDAHVTLRRCVSQHAAHQALAEIAAAQ